MYHERQSRQMCLVHALNALFQRPQFSSQSLDEICYALNDKRWFNPHRSMLGLGNYDANVLMSALGMYDYQVFSSIFAMLFFVHIFMFSRLWLCGLMVGCR
ncbi:hypothetical protein Y032_0115g508 [Ancylostoma ceylanicum]|uniref:ubiquitinyl hydrolase 1 n=1 Tax=Ancylostoma ceylanicum TaxID=53326 RepID=A0A016TCW1_9BILA|nr:hypothetical protein Y032_0115g508 [Ancylostoma ceylanicum]